MRFALVAIGCLLAFGLAHFEPKPPQAAAAPTPTTAAETRDPVLLAPAQRTQFVSLSDETIAHGATSSDEVEETAEEVLSRGEAPKDPIERGTSTLLLSLTDASSGEATSSSVQLWRIDAPGNQIWTRGDRLYARGDVLWDQATPFLHLPKGSYRVYALHQRKDSKDRAAFAIGPGVNRVSLAIAMPKTYPVLVEIHNEQGVALTQATSHSTYGSIGSGSLQPGWVEPRAVRSTGGVIDALGYVECCGGDCLHHEGEQLTAEQGYFEPDTVSQPSRMIDISWSCQIDAPGYVPVHLHASYEVPRAHVFRATTVSVADIHNVLFLPDGRRAVDAGAKIDTSVEAHLDGSPIRSSGVLVTVKLDGFKRLRRRLPIGEPWQRIELVPSDEPK